MPLEPGTRLDAYEIVRLLGSGGMGEVWLATEVRLGRKVALKLLPPDLTREPSRVLRFEQEARAASALSHPNVCTILALGETSDGLRYIAMEYVEGQTLRTQLGRTRLSIRAALDIAVQVAAALSTAHASGIVHRDIKPENVMVRPDGLVKVLDFGLAKLAPSPAELAGAESTRLVLKTDAGVVVGTAAYMSPEQARGQEVDARTDIWSLGVLLYEMVAGRSPFAAPSGTEVLAAILDRDPAPLARFDPDTPVELQRIVTKCLRKERALRYQGAQDLLLDLEALRDDVHAQARSGSGSAARAATEPAPPQPSGAVARVARRKPLVLAAAGALLVAAAAGGIWWWRAAGARPPESDTGAAVDRPLTRLTSSPGLQTDVTFSPDGRFIAYASDQGGNFDIWVQPVAGGGDPVQVTKSPAPDTEPDWSPDGSRIVFRSERDGGGLYLVPALGGPERRLTAFGVRPKWSPDGSMVLFSTAPPGLLSGLDGPLFVVATDGSPPRRVLQRFTEEAGGIVSWTWHPDGRRISVLARTLKGPDMTLYTVPLDRGAPVVTTLPPPLTRYLVVGEFVWAPAGNALYFEHKVNLISNVWRLRVDPATLEAGAFVRLTTGAGQDTRVAIARDGGRLAFTIKAESIRIWSYPLDPRDGRVSGPGEPVTDATAAVPGSAALSPDGRHLAYSIAGVGTGKWELWTTDLSTKYKRLLARDDHARADPKWSRDGRRLVYGWIRLKGGNFFQSSLAVRETSAADETLLSTPAEHIVQPNEWSPDGTSILVSWLRPGRHSLLALWPVAAAPRADAAASIVTEDPQGGVWQGRYSPNGRWISFVMNPSGRLFVCVIPRAAGRVGRDAWRCLTDPRGWTDKPRWSSDGKLLYVWRRDGSLFNVWALPFDDARGTTTGSPFQVTRFDNPAHRIWADDIGAAEPSLSHNRMTLPIADATGGIWLLENVDK
jgi:eukaryotic-like serine/threonine-protein kinase